MNTYKETIEVRIPEILKECSEPNWDSYHAEPVSKIALDRTVEILKRLEMIDVPCPEVYADADGDVELGWNWSKGDWRIPLDKQERYAWEIIIVISNHNLDGPSTDEEANGYKCMFFESDNREGVSKNGTKNFHLYFNYEDEFSKEMVDKLNQLKEWKGKIP